MRSGWGSTVFLTKDSLLHGTLRHLTIHRYRADTESFTYERPGAGVKRTRAPDPYIFRVCEWGFDAYVI